MTAMTMPNLNETLTKEVIEAMTDDDLFQLHRQMTIAQFANLREQLTPCDHSPDDVPGQPHGMHSDDGWDYLNAALQLASELHELTMETFPTTGNDQMRAWLLNKIDSTSDDHIFNYACDGVAELLWTLFMNDDED